MKAVLQRVSHCSVTVDGQTISSIGTGLLVLLGVGYEDTEADIAWLVRKISQMRIFPDENDVMNLSVMDTGGDILVVSQFTLMASCKKGNRPAYIAAATPDIAVPMYESFCSDLSSAIGKSVRTGRFGADMKVELLNDGPVTICLDSKNPV